MPVDFYARVARAATRHGQKFVLDTFGDALRAALGSGIEILKPSLGELETLIGREARDRAAQEAEALALVRSGAARMVAVSLGRDGALLAMPTGAVHIAAPKVAETSAAGAATVSWPLSYSPWPAARTHRTPSPGALPRLPRREPRGLSAPPSRSFTPGFQPKLAAQVD